MWLMQCHQDLYPHEVPTQNINKIIHMLVIKIRFCLLLTEKVSMSCSLCFETNQFVSFALYCLKLSSKEQHHLYSTSSSLRKTSGATDRYYSVFLKIRIIFPINPAAVPKKGEYLLSPSLAPHLFLKRLKHKSH